MTDVRRELAGYLPTLVRKVNLIDLERENPYGPALSTIDNRGQTDI